MPFPQKVISVWYSGPTLHLGMTKQMPKHQRKSSIQSMKPWACGFFFSVYDIATSPNILQVYVEITDVCVVSDIANSCLKTMRL